MSLHRNSWEIEQQIIGICYNMHNIPWSDAWMMSAQQRERVIKYINKRIEEQNNQMRNQQ